MAGPQWEGWVPSRVRLDQGQPRVDWCYLGTRRFVESFFDQTIERCFRHPFPLLFQQQTSIDALSQWRAQRPGLPPAGFIFHMSRCGSTLVAQMLAASARHIVISEAPPLDAVLRAQTRLPHVTEEERIEWLQGLVSALGQPRAGAEQRVFIKFDAWHTLDLPLIRRAFPGVPWIFVYRDPREVLVSQLRQRAALTVPGFIGWGMAELEPAVAVNMSPEEYCARVLARICQAALDQLTSGAGLAVNYRELPDAVSSTILDLFQVPRLPDVLDPMRQAAQQDAKKPSLPFIPDTDHKQRAITDQVRQATDRFLTPLYTQLEALRQQRAQVTLAPQGQGDRA